MFQQLCQLQTCPLRFFVLRQKSESCAPLVSGNRFEGEREVKEGEFCRPSDNVCTNEKKSVSKLSTPRARVDLRLVELIVEFRIVEKARN
jgi:hypothetical protein